MGIPGTPTVAKKKKSESRRFNTLVRMNDELCDKARKLAALRGISMAEMFTDVLRPWVDREWSKEVKRLAEEEGKRGEQPR
jgi:predicted ATPase